jgi:hypothetical protein
MVDLADPAAAAEKVSSQVNSGQTAAEEATTAPSSTTPCPLGQNFKTVSGGCRPPPKSGK